MPLNEQAMEDEPKHMVNYWQGRLHKKRVGGGQKLFLGHQNMTLIPYHV